MELGNLELPLGRQATQRHLSLPTFLDLVRLWGLSFDASPVRNVSHMDRQSLTDYMAIV
jgi:hypothetical protein